MSDLVRLHRLEVNLGAPGRIGQQVGRQGGEAAVRAGRVLAVVAEHIDCLRLALGIDEAFGAWGAALASHLAAATVRASDRPVVDGLPVAAEDVLKVIAPGQRGLPLLAGAQALLRAQGPHVSQTATLLWGRDLATGQSCVELVEQGKQLRHQPVVLGAECLGAQVEALAQYAPGDQEPALLAHLGDGGRAQREPLSLGSGLYLDH